MWIQRTLLVCLLTVLVTTHTESKKAKKVKKPRIYFLHIQSDIRFRYATTVVTSKVVNPDHSKARETTFDVTLPNEAFITNFTITVKDKVFVADVKRKQEARQAYDVAKSKGKTAAHISVKPRETNVFQIQLNVEAEQKVTFELRYQELLQRKLGRYKHVIYVKPGEPVEDLRVDIDIFDTREITKFKVPAIKKGVIKKPKKGKTAASEVAVVEYISKERVHVRYEPSFSDQTSGGRKGLDEQFAVEYDVKRQKDGGELLMMNGYFVHFFSPSGLKPKPKDVVFILDTSGSMRGRKMIQLIQAMTNILTQVTEADRFNILVFNRNVHAWNSVKSFLPATAENKKKATAYVKGMEAGGSTNIEAAMKKGISLLDGRKNKKKTPVLIFLTDGEPTTGETNAKKLLTMVKKINEDQVPIFSLAFGNRADYNFVKKVSAQNHGFGRKIYEDSDAALQISSFYKEISTVLLQDIKFTYLNGSVDSDTLTKSKFQHFFQGSEIIVAGKMASEVTKEMMPNVIADGADGEFGVHVPKDSVVDAQKQLNLTSNSDIHNILERLWAYLTIKQRFKDLDAATSETEQDKIRQNITSLALKYKFVTPLTSMVLILPEKMQSSPVDLLQDSPETSAMPSRVSSMSHVSSSVRSFGGLMGRQPVLRRGRVGRKRFFRPVKKIRKMHSQFANMPPMAVPRPPPPPAVGSMGASMDTEALLSADPIQFARVRTTSGQGLIKTPWSSTNIKPTKPADDKAADYTLVSIKGITLPLCVTNPDSADEAKMYTLFNDPTTGTVVNVGYTHTGTGTHLETRINRVIITTAIITELFPSHYTVDGIRRDWTPNKFRTYVQGTPGAGVSVEVTSQNNRKLIVHLDFTQNTAQNLGGSLGLPLSATIDRIPKLSIHSKQMGKLVLTTKRSGLSEQTKAMAKLSELMQCWIVRSRNILMLQEAV